MELDIWSTSDLALAAWVACRLGGPESVSRSSHKWRHFSFPNHEDCQRVALEFLVSEAHLFDAAVRAIRKVSAGFYWSEVEQDGAWSTRELSLAAFAVVTGSELCKISSEENGSGRSFFVYHFSGGDRSSVQASWETSEAKIFDEQVRRLKRMS